VYRVLLRDRGAIAELVGGVLTPLTQARGGAQPLLDTLGAYFASGGVAAEAARRMHLGTRTVTYRLERVRALPGYSATYPGTASPSRRPSSAPGCWTGPAPR
jgi:DNA-binding PucR family transcriptional regulator